MQREQRPECFQSRCRPAWRTRPWRMAPWRAAWARCGSAARRREALHWAPRWSAEAHLLILLRLRAAQRLGLPNSLAQRLRRRPPRRQTPLRLPTRRQPRPSQRLRGLNRRRRLERRRGAPLPARRGGRPQSRSLRASTACWMRCARSSVRAPRGAAGPAVRRCGRPSQLWV